MSYRYSYSTFFFDRIVDLAAVRSGQARTQPAVARKLGLNETVLTYLPDDMESANLITRRRDPADRRAHRIVLTAEGERALPRTARPGRCGPAGRPHATGGRAVRGLLERVARTAERKTLGAVDTC